MPKSKKKSGKKGTKDKTWYSFLLTTTTLWWSSKSGCYAIVPHTRVNCAAKGLHILTTSYACQVDLESPAGDRKLRFPIEGGRYITVDRTPHQAQSLLWNSAAKLYASYQARSNISKFGGAGLEYQSISGWPGTHHVSQLTAKDAAGLFSDADPRWSYPVGRHKLSIIWRDVDALGVNGCDHQRPVGVDYVCGNTQLAAPNFLFLSLEDHQQETGVCHHPHDVQRRLEAVSGGQPVYAVQSGYVTDASDPRVLQDWKTTLSDAKDAGLLSDNGKFIKFGVNPAPRLSWAAASDPAELDTQALTATELLMQGSSSAYRFV